MSLETGDMEKMQRTHLSNEKVKPENQVCELVLEEGIEPQLRRSRSQIRDHSGTTLLLVSS
jgi:hypothetical protein